MSDAGDTNLSEQLTRAVARVLGEGALAALVTIVETSRVPVPKAGSVKMPTTWLSNKPSDPESNHPRLWTDSVFKTVKVQPTV